MKSHILAMLTDKQTLHYKLFNVAEPLVVRLIKLIQYPKAQAKDDWIKEIYLLLNNVPLFRFSKKLPSAKFIYDELSAYNDVISSMILLAKDSEPDEQFAYISESDCLHAVQLYQTWLAEQLSIRGYVLLGDVKDQLASMGLLDN